MRLKLSNNPAYANLIPRFVAVVIDESFLYFVTLLALFFLVQSSSLADLISQGIILTAILILPALLLNCLYKVWCISKFGKTIGKALVGVEVTDLNGQHLSFTMTALREFVTKPVSSVVFCVGIWSILFEPQHRAWHDLLSGTVVHQKKKHLIVGLIIAGTMIICIGFASGLIISLAMQNQALINGIKNPQ